MEILGIIIGVAISYAIYMRIQYSKVAKAYRNSVNYLIIEVEKGKSNSAIQTGFSFEHINNLILHYPEHTIHEGLKQKTATYKLDDYAFILTEYENQSILSMKKEDFSFRTEQSKYNHILECIEELKKYGNSLTKFQNIESVIELLKKFDIEIIEIVGNVKINDFFETQEIIYFIIDKKVYGIYKKDKGIILTDFKGDGGIKDINWFNKEMSINNNRIREKYIDIDEDEIPF